MSKKIAEVGVCGLAIFLGLWLLFVYIDYVVCREVLDLRCFIIEELCRFN